MSDAVTPGSLVGPYRIDSLLGVGGMGEVYRARDTQLNRDVAIKILPAAFATDPERLARFKREAQVLASLNHPNIGAIYGFEDAGPVAALVLELVEGPTLADRIANGPLPIDEALSVARQIADALECAHEAGVVHRDLKPANIKVRDDGTVKVLDFGLAKLAEPVGAAAAAAALTQSPTITTPAMTAAGIILGTAAYMSPEQAKGKPADQRSDIWAFGCVLYEMLTGKRAFDGDDVSETLAAILRAVPDWTALPAATPRAIRKLLVRCVQKDRRERLADIADARFEIVDTQREAPGQGEAATVASSRSNVRVHLAWIAAATLLALAVGLASSRLRPLPPQAGSIRFEIQPPEGWTKPFDNRPATGVASATISPDGAHVAFLARNDGGETMLWIRTLNQLTSRQLAGTQGALGPFWSPDSRYIAFFADDKLKKVEISGSAPQTLCEALLGVTSGTWGRDGVIVFSDVGSRVQTNGLKQVPATGGVPRSATVLQPGEVGHLRPAFLPDGRHFVYRAPNGTTSGNTWIGSLDSSDRTLLFEGTSTGNVAFAGGRLLFMRGTTLVAQHFDTTSLKLSGTPVPVAEQVETSGLIPPVGAFSVSDNGTLAYRTSHVTLGGQLTLLDRAGTVLATSGDRGDYSDVELSPDGKRAAIAVRDPDAATRDIWIADIERGTRDRFTLNPAGSMRSAWSPDGSQLAFSRDQGRMDVFIKPANGSTPVEQPLLANDDFGRSFERVPLSWSSDGIILLEVGSRVGSLSTHTELWMVRTTGDRKAVPILQRPFNVSQGRLSPDGRWVAYVSEETGQPNVYVTPFPGPGSHTRVSVDGATQPRWASDGHELVFIRSGELRSADVHLAADGVTVGRPTRLFSIAVQNAPFLSSYDVSRDGQRFLVNMLNTNAQQTASPIAVVLNWTAGLP